MAVSLYAANEGYLEDIELNKVLDFEASLLSYMNSENAELMDKINNSGDYNDDIEAQFKVALEQFKATQSW
jgi:F-type H+-transporting ATPase subunit alpha